MISALQHYAYCPRRFALIHVEQVWDENRFTAEGKILHERVDKPNFETRKDRRYERAVLLCSEKFGIYGQMDLLEIILSDPPVYFPVEFKRGKSEINDQYKMQVCAQAFCIEEMRDTHIEECAIWHWESRKRERVILDDELRQSTIGVIRGCREILQSGNTPPAVYENRKCRGCSMNSRICHPKLFNRDRSSHYIDEIGQ